MAVTLIDPSFIESLAALALHVLRLLSYNGRPPCHLYALECREQPTPVQSSCMEHEMRIGRST